MRSGTLDAAGDRRLRRRGRSRPTDRRELRPRRLAALRDDLVAPGAARPCRDAVLNGDPAPTACRATPTSPSPAARATRCCCCSTPRASSARPARPARPGWPSPATCCSRWAPTRTGARGSLRFSLGHTSTAADVDALRRRRCRRPSSGPGARARPGRPRRRGGLTCRCWPRCRAASTRRSRPRGRSTPATTSPACTSRCREPADAYRTGARGCCTLEDARDARRAADVHRHPVLRLGPRRASSPADVVDDFVAEYAAGRTPNPCLRCNEKIKFAAVLDRAPRARLRRGRAPATTPGSSTADGAAAPRRRPGQGPVLRARRARRRASWPARCSRSATRRRPRCAPRRPSAGLAVADKPDSHDICFIADGDTARLPRAAALGAGPGDIVDAETGATPRRPRRRVRVHRRPAPRPRPRRAGAGGRAALRRRITRSPARCGRPADAARRATRSHAARPAGAGRRRARPARCSVQVRAHGEPVGAVVREVGDRVVVVLRCRCAASPPARRWCSTPGTGCSGRPPSTAPTRRAARQAG